MRNLFVLLLLALSTCIHAEVLRTESIVMIDNSDERLANYGEWRFTPVTAESLDDKFRKVLQEAINTEVGSYQEGNGYYRVLSHRTLEPVHDNSLYYSLDWFIDETLHRTLWYHLYDRRPDKQAIDKLKSAFYSRTGKEERNALRREIYDGDTDWPWDLIDYLAGSIEAPVLRITLRNVSEIPADVTALTFTHLLSWGGEADADVIETKRSPADVVATLHWKKPAQRFMLASPLHIQPGKAAQLDVRLIVEDASAGDGDGTLLTLMEAKYTSGNHSGTLHIGAFELNDSLRDLAY